VYLEGKKEAPHRMLAKIASKNSGLKFKLKAEKSAEGRGFPLLSKKGILKTAFSRIVTPNFEGSA
jgi:hypothetical protein